MDDIDIIQSLPTLQDPNQFGILLQCRQKMDKLNFDQMIVFAHSIVNILNHTQLVSLLFEGLYQNIIGQNLEYSQLFKMKSILSKMIDEDSKTKITRKTEQTDANDSHSTDSKITKKSLSIFIPTDIISNKICTFLSAATIQTLAKCDRTLAIVCHTPTAISNMVHKPNPYRYCDTDELYTIDGIFQWNEITLNSDIHRFRNIEYLSISVTNMLQYQQLLKLQNVKHLSMFDESNYERPHTHWEYQLNDMSMMPLLQHITFMTVDDLPFILSFLKQYTYQKNENKYFNDIIYNIKSIQFIDCQLWSLHNGDMDFDEMIALYPNIAHFLFPSTPNNIQILKFENSVFLETDGYVTEDDDYNPKISAANKMLTNFNRMKSSLSNLKGLVYSVGHIGGKCDCYFKKTAEKILDNLKSFPKLKSIHYHSSLWLYDKPFVNVFKKNMNNIQEICISLSLGCITNSEILKNISFNTELTKLCLVINMETVNTYKKECNYVDAVINKFINQILFVFRSSGKLRLFQITAVMKNDKKNDDCCLKLDFLMEFCKSLSAALDTVSSHRENQTPLLFKFHIKSCHRNLYTKCTLNSYKKSNERCELFDDILIKMMTNYLITYPKGKFQMKYTRNTQQSLMLFSKLKLLDRIFDFESNETGKLLDHSMSHKLDYKQNAFSARCKGLNPNIEYDRTWSTDCKYCCNTPWL
eukprot:302709_1